MFLAALLTMQPVSGVLGRAYRIDGRVSMAAGAEGDARFQQPDGIPAAAAVPEPAASAHATLGPSPSPDREAASANATAVLLRAGATSEPERTAPPSAMAVRPRPTSSPRATATARPVDTATPRATSTPMATPTVPPAATATPCPVEGLAVSLAPAVQTLTGSESWRGSLTLSNLGRTPSLQALLRVTVRGTAEVAALQVLEERWQPIAGAPHEQKLSLPPPGAKAEVAFSAAARLEVSLKPPRLEAAEVLFEVVVADCGAGIRVVAEARVTLALQPLPATVLPADLKPATELAR
jgi:hypothetical protein